MKCEATARIPPRRFLAGTEEATTPAVRDILAVGPTYHRKWHMTVFSDTMAGLPRTQRDRRLAQLVAFCDLHNLGRPEDQLGLGRRATELALSEIARTPLVAKS
jgi:hypothetical protein